MTVFTVRRWKQLLMLLVIVGAALAASITTPGFAETFRDEAAAVNGPIPDPVADPENPDIFYGATPPAPNGDVLVFVHGYGAQAEVWWVEGLTSENNDFYERAYTAGYHTAFVTLKDLDTNPGPSSMWVHGERLAAQLAVITDHYEVEKVNIVAHSKGGLDSEAAIVHYGADAFVERVFTLATPHLGTELVDLIYTPELQNFATVLGLINPATETMTTAYVENEFRPITDPIQQQQDVAYWRAAGTSNDPVYSGAWFTGRYLNAFGPNDGVVPLARTQLPIARQLFTRHVNHMQVPLGEHAFNPIQKVITTGNPATTLFLPMTLGGDGTAPPPMQSESIVVAEFYLNVGNPKIITLGAIEPDTVEASFAALVLNESFTGSLIQPDGTEIPLEGQPTQGGVFFEQLWLLAAIVEDPQPGEWKLKVQGPQVGAIFMIAEIISPLDVTVEGVPPSAISPGQPLTLQVRGTHPSGEVRIDEVTVRILAATNHGDGPDAVREVTALGDRVDLPFLTEPGLHSISIHVSGQLASGAPFSRSEVRTLWVEGTAP